MAKAKIKVPDDEIEIETEEEEDDGEERILYTWSESWLSNGLLRGLVCIILLGIPLIWRQKVVVTDQRLKFSSGILRTIDEIELTKVRDVKVQERHLIPKLFGIGDIIVHAVQIRKAEELVLRGVPKCVEIRETIRNYSNVR